jgi:hypothetical protein
MLTIQLPEVNMMSEKSAASTNNDENFSIICVSQENVSYVWSNWPSQYIILFPNYLTICLTNSHSQPEINVQIYIHVKQLFLWVKHIVTVILDLKKSYISDIYKEWESFKSHTDIFVKNYRNIPHINLFWKKN